MMTRRSLLLGSAAAVSAAAAPVGFCISTYGMKDLPLDAALRLIADTGYDGVELALMPGWQTDPARMTGQDRAHLRSLLKQARLAVPALNDQLPITPATRARNLERLKLAASLAHFLSPEHPPLFETMLGGQTEKYDKDYYVSELGAWADLARSVDLTVCFKPHAGHAIHNPERALEVLRAVNSPRLKVCYDYCHMFVAKESLESSMRQLGPQIGFITLKDARWTDTGYEFLLPGDGDTDYDLYFRLLKEIGYKGWGGVEVSAMVFRKPGYHPAAAARRTYQKIAPHFGKAGIQRPARP